MLQRSLACGAARLLGGGGARSAALSRVARPRRRCELVVVQGRWPMGAVSGATRPCGASGT
eukprot:1158282-Prymnesium_polylepis.2